MGIESRNSNAMPAPSPMCDSRPIVMTGTAKTVTGLANNIRKPSPRRFSKCIKSMAKKTSTKASLIGRPVQKADQSTPRPIFVGDKSRSSLIASCDQLAPILVQKLAVDDGGHRKQQNRHHHDNPADQGDRTLENVPFGIAVDKGQRRQQGHERTGQGDGPEELAELTGKDFQPQQLEQEEKIPFGLRMVIAEVGRRFFEQHDRLPA